MNRKISSMALVLGISAMIISSCSKDSTPDNSNTGGGTGKSKYVFVVTSDGTSGESAKYIITSDDLTKGELSIKKNGVETNAYSFVTQNNTLFGITYATSGPTQAFRLNTEGELVKHSNVVNTEFTGAYTPIDSKYYVGVSISGGLATPQATLYKFDAENIKVDSRRVFSTKMIGNDEIANYNGIMEVGKKLYMPLLSTPGVSGQVTKYIDSAWIAVFDKATLEYQKVIRTDKIGPIGSWFSMQGVQQISTGDVYAWSTSSSNSAHVAKNKSGIIKINSTTDEVDTKYFFDVETKTGHKIARGSYLKDGKFLMTLYQTSAVGGITGGVVNLAIVDVINQTVKDVAGVPNHAQMAYDNKVLVENNGKTAYYVMKNDAGNHYVYTIDVDNATATQGVRFVGIKDVSAISKLKF